jgi:hypothetical protein
MKAVNKQSSQIGIEMVGNDYEQAVEKLDFEPPMQGAQRRNVT